MLSILFLIKKEVPRPSIKSDAKTIKYFLKEGNLETGINKNKNTSTTYNSFADASNTIRIAKPTRSLFENFLRTKAKFKTQAINKNDNPLVIISALIEELIDSDIGSNAKKTSSHFWKGIVLIAM